MKVCSTCGEEKELSEFGRYRQCKSCIRATQKRYYKANRDKVINTSAKWHRDNPEKVKEKSITWRKANLDKVSTFSANRRAAKLKRTPHWLTDEDYEKISEFYQVAKMLTEVTEVAYVVDHIIPLQGKIVSGLHTPNNLQVITKSDNCKKSNKFTP